jgi:DNA-binding transcriptional ArsR family regulator
MKRNIDLIRLLLLEIESFGEFLEDDEKQELEQLKDFPESVIGQHLELLQYAGYVRGDIAIDIGGRVTYSMDVFRLTWEGYELVDNLRDKVIWKDIKTKLNGVKSFSFRVLEEVAQYFMMKYVGRQLHIQFPLQPLNSVFTLPQNTHTVRKRIVPEKTSPRRKKASPVASNNLTLL